MSSRLENADAFELMATLEDGSVDAVITDPPYGTTDNAWDTAPDWAALTKELRRVLKPHGVACIFAQVPVTIDLISAAWDWFRYELIWVKNTPLGFLNSAFMPLRKHEVINVFCDGVKSSTYNPQMIRGGTTPRAPSFKHNETSNYSKMKGFYDSGGNGDAWPSDVLFYDRDANGWHPTQKPVNLLRWLVRTYTNPGELVLDPYAGSASTAIACIREERDFVGSERDAGYHAKASERIRNEESQMTLFSAVSLS